MSENRLTDFAEQVMAVEGSKSLPPVEQWQPKLSGSIDIRIARDGTWWHEGEPFQRLSLVKLFSRILKREGNHYYLVTPLEKWQIQVDDVPFQVVDMEQAEFDGKPVLVFKTRTDDTVVLSKENPLRIETDPNTEEPSPYLLIRANMEGLINRNTFYRLVKLAEVIEDQYKTRLKLQSNGDVFIFG